MKRSSQGPFLKRQQGLSHAQFIFEMTLCTSSSLSTSNSWRQFMNIFIYSKYKIQNIESDRNHIQMSQPLNVLVPNYVKNLELSFEEHQNQLNQKVASLQMLTQMLRQFNVKLMQKFNENQQRLIALLERKKKVDQSHANAYLSEKVEKQGQKQLKKILKEMEERIYEVRTTLYDKEVEITVDHMGKKRQQSITFENLKKFDSFQNKKNQFQNLTHARNRLQKQLQIKSQAQSPVEIKVLTPIQNNSSNPENQRTKVKQIQTLSSQTKITVRKHPVSEDPLIGKLLKLMRVEVQKEKHLLSESKELKDKWKTVCLQNRSLSEKYRKKMKMI